MGGEGLTGLGVIGLVEKLVLRSRRVEEEEGGCEWFACACVVVLRSRNYFLEPEP